LDPAGPLYYNQDEELTIGTGAADFVDNIHTNGGFILEVRTTSSKICDYYAKIYNESFTIHQITPLM